MQTKQNETDENKNTQQVRFSICVILLSVVIFYEYITTPKAMDKHTLSHTHACTFVNVNVSQLGCTAAISFI